MPLLTCSYIHEVGGHTCIYMYVTPEGLHVIYIHIHVMWLPRSVRKLIELVHEMYMYFPHTLHTHTHAQTYAYTCAHAHTHTHTHRPGKKGLGFGPVMVQAWYGSSSKVVMAIWKMARDQHVFYRSKRVKKVQRVCVCVCMNWNQFYVSD